MNFSNVKTCLSQSHKKRTLSHYHSLANIPSFRCSQDSKDSFLARVKSSEKLRGDKNKGFELKISENKTGLLDGMNSPRNAFNGE